MRVVAIILATCERLRGRLAQLDVPVEPGGPDDLASGDTVYVVGCDAATLPAACELAARAAAMAPAPGMLAVIDGAGPTEREVALAAGYDDAVASAVHPRELTGRIRSVQRRLVWQEDPNRVRYGALICDLTERIAWDDTGTRAALTGYETAVLRELINARGRAVTYTELYRAVWLADAKPAAAAREVQTIVTRLRGKVRPDAIETVRRFGVRLTGR